MKRRDDPFWRRPVKWDAKLKRFRRDFWDELSDTQRLAELDFHAHENRLILAELGPRLKRHGIEQTIIHVKR